MHEISNCQVSVDHNSGDTKFKSCEIVENLSTKYLWCGQLYMAENMER